MTHREESLRDGVADANWSSGIHRHIHRIVAHLFHFSGEVVFEMGKLIDGGAVGGVGNGGFLVFQGALSSRAAEFPSQFGADGFLIISGPGIEHGGAGNGHLAGETGGHGADAFDIAGGGFEHDVEPLVGDRGFVIAGLMIGDLLGGSHRSGGSEEDRSCATEAGDVCFKWDYHSLK